MKYATFDSNGLDPAFYDEVVHGPRMIDGFPNPDSKIPNHAIEITDEQWLEFLEHNGLRKWHNGHVVQYDPPPQPEHVPVSISDRQFFQQLAIAGLITKPEALSAVQTGTMPQSFVDFIAQLPSSKRFAAEMLLTGATTFERANPLTDAFGAMYGMDSEQVDKLWQDATKL